MIVICLGRWDHAAGRFFTLTRIYRRGRWTPFCHIKKRYASWLGYWQNPLGHH